MMKLSAFLKEEDGMGTAEVVIIAAVLVAIAILFKERITEFVKKIMERGLNEGNITFE